MAGNYDNLLYNAVQNRREGLESRGLQENPDSYYYEQAQNIRSYAPTSPNYLYSEQHAQTLANIEKYNDWVDTKNRKTHYIEASYDFDQNLQEQKSKVKQANTASKKKKYLAAQSALDELKTNLAYASDPATESQLRAEYAALEAARDKAKADYESSKEAATAKPNYLDTVQIADNADQGKVSSARTTYETAEKTYNDMLAAQKSGDVAAFKAAMEAGGITAKGNPTHALEQAKENLDKAKAEYEMYATTPEQAEKYEKMNPLARGLTRIGKAVDSAVSGLIPKVSAGIAQAGTKAAQALDTITADLNLTRDARVAYAYANDVDYELTPAAHWKPGVESITQEQFDAMPDNVKNRFGTVDKFNSALADANYQLGYKAAAATSEEKREQLIEDTAPMRERSQRLMQEATTGTYGAAKFGLELIPSSVEMAADVVINRMTGINGLANMGARVFGGSYLDARDQGVDDNTATLYGIANAAVEVLTEMIGGESIVNQLAYKNTSLLGEPIENAIAKIGDKTAQKLALWAVGGVEEGIEEALSEAANPLVEAILETEYWDAVKEKYGEQRGMDYVKAAVGGAIMSLAGGAAADVVSGSINTIKGNGFQTVTDNKLADIALNNQIVNSEAAKRAIDAKVASGEYSEQGAANAVKKDIQAYNRLGEDLYVALQQKRTPQQIQEQTKTYQEYSYDLDTAKEGSVLVDSNLNQVGKVITANDAGIVIETKSGKDVVVTAGLQGLLDPNSQTAKYLADGARIMSANEYKALKEEDRKEQAKPKVQEMATESPESASTEKSNSVSPQSQKASEAPSDELNSKSDDDSKQKRALTLFETESEGEEHTTTVGNVSYVSDSDSASIDNINESKENYELGGERFDAEAVKRMTAEDVVYRLKAWAKKLGLGGIKGFASKIGAVVTAIQDMQGKNGQLEQRLVVGASGRVQRRNDFSNKNNLYRSAYEQSLSKEGLQKNRADSAFMYLLEQDADAKLADVLAKVVGKEENYLRPAAKFVLESIFKRAGLDMSTATVAEGIAALAESGEVNLAETLGMSEEDIEEIFALLDRTGDIEISFNGGKHQNLNDILSGNIDLTTTNDSSYTEKDFHDESTRAEAIKAINEDIEEANNNIDGLKNAIEIVEQSAAYSSEDVVKDTIDYLNDQIKKQENRIDQLESEKQRYLDEEEADTKKADKSERDASAEMDVKTAAEEQAEDDRAVEQERGRKPEQRKALKNGPAFIKASDMPAEHKSGSGGRVRGIKVNGETYYAVSSLAKGGYRNIMPDADVAAAKAVIDAFKTAIEQQKKTAQHYLDMAKNGDTLTKQQENILAKAEQASLDLQQKLDKINNGEYTLQDFWNDRTIPKDIKKLGPSNEDIRNRSLSAIANAVAETDAIRGIEAMEGVENGEQSTLQPGERENGGFGIEANNKADSGRDSPSGSRNGRRSDSYRKQAQSDSEERNEGLALQERDGGLQEKRTPVRNKSATNKAISDADNIGKTATSVPEAEVSLLKNRYEVIHCDDGSIIGVVGKVAAAIKGKVFPFGVSREAIRLNTKAKRGDCVFTYIAAGITVATKAGGVDVNPVSGYATTTNGKRHIFGGTLADFNHEVTHDDVRRANRVINTLIRSGSSIQVLGDQIHDVLVSCLGQDLYEKFKTDAIVNNNYTEGRADEEIFSELVSMMYSKTKSDWDTSTLSYTNYGKLLAKDANFKNFVDTMRKYSDMYGTGNYQVLSAKRVAQAGDLGIIEDANPTKNDFKDYPSGSSWMDEETRADIEQTVNEIYEDMGDDVNSVPTIDAEHLNQWERAIENAKQTSGITSAETTWDNGKYHEPYEQMKQVKETAGKHRSIFDAPKLIPKSFGSRSEIKAAGERRANIISMIQGVADGTISVTSLFSYAQTHMNIKGTGQYFTQDIVDALQRAAMTEAAAYASANPDGSEMKDFRYTAANAVSMLANQIKVVDSVERNFRMPLTEAASKYGKEGSNEKGFVKSVGEWIHSMQIDGGNFWRMIGGFDKNSRNAGYAMQKRHDRAVATQIKTMAEAKAHFAAIKAGEGYTDFANGKAKSSTKVDGHEISLLQAVKLKMVMDTLKAQSEDRLQSLNGFAIRDTRGKDVFVDIPGELDSADRREWIENLYEGISADIEGNESAKAYMDAAVEMFADIAPRLQSEAQKVMGYQKSMFGKGQYVPIQYASKDVGKSRDWELVSDMKQGLNYSSIIQNRTRSYGGYAVINAISQTVDSYISQASNYIAFADLGNQLNILGNKASLGGSYSDLIRNQYGNSYGRFFDNYVKAINMVREPTSDDLGPFGKLLSGSRNAMMQGALIGSLSVPIKQVSSYFSSAGVIDPRAVTRALRPIGRSSTKGIDNPFMKSRLQGSVDPDVSQALDTGLYGWIRNHSKLGAAVLNATNIMDSRTVANVYKAAILDVEWNSGLSKEQLYKNGKDWKDGFTANGEFLVNAKFEDAVLNTQPIFTRQARNELARTDNQILRMLSTFRTQQTQNYNRMVTTWGEYQAAKMNGEDTEASKKAFTQTLSGQIAASASLGALSILADIAKHKLKKYKDDDDEIDGQKIFDRWWKNSVEALAGTTVFGDSLAKLFIDAVSGKAFDKYADKEFYNVPVGSISSVITAGNYIRLLVDDILNNDAKHLANYTKLAVNNTATLFGIPAANAYTIINAGVQFYKDIMGEGSREYEDIAKAWDAQRTDYGNNLINAMQTGNQKKADKITNYLMKKAQESAEADGVVEEGEAEKKYQDSLKTLIQRAGFERLKDGTADEEDYAEALMTYAGMTENEAYKYIQTRKMELDETNPEGIKYNSMKKAWMKGDLDDDQVVRYLQEYGGKDEPSAQRTLKSYKRDKAVAEMFGDINDVYSNDVDAYSKLGQAFYDGKIDRDEYKKALMEIGGEKADDAELKILDWECKTEYGYKLSEMGTAYNDGQIDAAQYKDALVKYGKKSDASVKSSIMSHLDSQYEDGKITKQQAISDYTKYTTATKEQAEVHFNKQDFKHKYGESYSNKALKNMLANKQITEKQALDWYMKCNDDATEKKANNWLERTRFENLTGYEAQWSYSSDLYDTYETKPKKGLMTFYEEYGNQFKSAKTFGKVFTTLNDDTKSYPEYHNPNGYDATDNQRRVITQMNKLIKQGDLTYETAYTIWTEHYGWKANARNAWSHVQRG